MVYKIEEVDSKNISLMNKEVENFGVVVATKHKKKFIELNKKFEKVLKAYDERGRIIY